MKITFLCYTVFFALVLFAVAALLAPLGDDWLMFGLVFGGSALAGLRLVWEKLNQVEQKLDKLLEQEKGEP